MPKKRNPKVLSIAELKSKGTRELLGYLNRLRRCEESFTLSDIEIDPGLSDSDTIYFKATEKWKVAY